MARWSEQGCLRSSSNKLQKVPFLKQNIKHAIWECSEFGLADIFIQCSKLGRFVVSVLVNEFRLSNRLSGFGRGRDLTLA